MNNEFRVTAKGLDDYAQPIPFGRIGEEVPPTGMSVEEYPRTIEFRDGQRFIRFSRPFRPDVRSKDIATDANNGMWIPDRFLELVS